MEVLLSAVDSDLIGRLVSFLIRKYQDPGAADDIVSLQRALLRASAVVEEAEGRQIANRAMLLLLNRLKGQMCRDSFVVRVRRLHEASRSLLPPGSDGADGLAVVESLEAALSDMREFVVLLSCTRGGRWLGVGKRTLEFSTMTLPDHISWKFQKHNFRITGGGEAVRILRVTDSGDLEIYRQPHGGEWELENSVRLAEASHGLPGRKEEYFSGPANIIKAGEGFVVLSPDEEKWLFSVDLDSLELEREHKRNKCSGPAFPYAPPWPPVLRACVETGGKRRHRR
ncbi:hypothetical protein ACP70R_049415 [Stipagrostis hirtigluma subsp. patula]